MSNFTDSITKATIDRKAQGSFRGVRSRGRISRPPARSRGSVAARSRSVDSASCGRRASLIPSRFQLIPSDYFLIPSKEGNTVLDHENEEAKVRQMPEFGDGPADPKPETKEA